MAEAWDLKEWRLRSCVLKEWTSRAQPRDEVKRRRVGQEKEGMSVFVTRRAVARRSGEEPAIRKLMCMCAGTYVRDSRDQAEMVWILFLCTVVLGTDQQAQE